jgi:hypothetical protein
MGHRKQEDAQWAGTLYNMLSVEIIECSIIAQQRIMCICLI